MHRAAAMRLHVCRKPSRYGALRDAREFAEPFCKARRATLLGPAEQRCAGKPCRMGVCAPGAASQAAPRVGHFSRTPLCPYSRCSVAALILLADAAAELVAPDRSDLHRFARLFITAVRMRNALLLAPLGIGSQRLRCVGRSLAAL
jgi:hypothetical protein